MVPCVSEEVASGVYLSKTVSCILSVAHAVLIGNHMIRREYMDLPHKWGLTMDRETFHHLQAL